MDTSANTLVDALSYEGAITSVTLTGFVNPANLVEGASTAAADSNTGDGSLCRIPNGADTDDAATDWQFSSTSTPGGANVP